jgi:hypothetical protein
VRLNDAEALLEAVIAGLGRSLLPCVVADGDSRLRRIGATRRGSVLSRELWLLTHSELRRLGRIEAAVKWIEQIAPHYHVAPAQPEKKIATEQTFSDLPSKNCSRSPTKYRTSEIS